MRALSVVIVTLVLFACSGGTARNGAGLDGHLTLSELVVSNQSKLARLSVGMSREDVISLMGTRTAKTRDGIVNNPWTIEPFVEKDGTRYEALYYMTRKNRPGAPVSKSLTTTIIIRNGKVVGWRENASDRLDIYLH